MGSLALKISKLTTVLTVTSDLKIENSRAPGVVRHSIRAPSQPVVQQVATRAVTRTVTPSRSRVGFRSHTVTRHGRACSLMLP